MVLYLDKLLGFVYFDDLPAIYIILDKACRYSGSGTTTNDREVT